MIERIDHLVLTTRDLDACIDFYTRVLGMTLVRFGERRIAFAFGAQKINVHEYGKEIEPKAHLPVPGSLDLCLISGLPTAEIAQRLKNAGVDIIAGPVARSGARGPITSFYLRDPDLNLIEISRYDQQ